MRTVLFAICCFAIAGCASTKPSYVEDTQYMQRVEMGARLAGAQVHWVNPPYIANTSTSSSQ